MMSNDEISKIISEKNENIIRLKDMLYNMIVYYYDNSLKEYSGLDDEDFIQEICDEIGLTKKEYKDLINKDTEPIVYALSVNNKIVGIYDDSTKAYDVGYIKYYNEDFVIDEFTIK